MAEEIEAEAVSRQARAASAFVELVETLVDEFDVIDTLTTLTTRCVELLEVSAAGILLADDVGTLRVIGSSNEDAHLLELLQVQNEEGPCLDAYRGGAVVDHPDLASGSPWPRFAAASVAAGFLAVCAVPMRLKRARMGCLNLFLSRPGRLSEEHIALAQGLADVACIAIAQDQTSRDAALREGHLQRALDSRILIEQAKGMIAAQTGLGMDASFNRLRSHARNTNERLTDVAKAVIDGSISMALGPSTRPRSCCRRVRAHGDRVRRPQPSPTSRRAPRTDLVTDDAADGSDERDVSGAEHALSRSSSEVIDAALRLVTTLAAATVDNADGVSVTLERRGRLVTVAASNDAVLTMDRHQYETGEGPCLAAKADGHSFYIESLDGETLWPNFVPLALGQGIHSILSSPLMSAARPRGALNIYSSTERAFGARQQDLAALFAEQASEILSTAERDVTDADAESRFTVAMLARRTIHRAQGVLMAQRLIGADEAGSLLLHEARTAAITVVDRAAQVLESVDPGDSGRSTRPDPT